jgi:putative membrane protein
MMHEYWSGPWGFGGMGGIFMLIFWVLLVVGIVWLIRYMITGRSCGMEHETTPLEVMKKRYAKGEIDKKEFEEKKKDLMSRT